MNNESINFTKIITTVSNTSASANNCSNTIIKSSSTSATQFSSLSSSFSISTSSQQPLSPSAQFDVTVNAIAAVVNASNNLPVTTPPKAAAVVAVAVSSLAAAFIPDTPIVSIAGSTLSEITTTTTSTKTTPTPFPTSKETADRSNNNSSASNTNITRNLNKNVQNKTSPSSSATPTVNPSSSSYSTAKASVKVLAPMSVANSSATGALTNASTTAANAGAAEIKNNTNSNKQIKEISTGNSAKGSCGTLCTKSDSLAITTDIKSIITTSPSQHVVENTKVTPSKTDDNNVTPNKTKSKDPVSESWEESRLKDWDDSKLKELLDEAYSYKNPRDKENKSKTFLQLLEKAENEDQSYPFCVTSRGARNLSNTITSSSYHHYTQNSHYQSHSHNHNRSHHHHHHHHHHKQGGSLQDLFEIGLHESPLDCDQTFGVGISGNQRLRRQNHNSRQKKYSTSVSSRQREGGSLPSNVNVTHQLNLGGNGVGGVVNDISLLQQDTSANKTNKKEQRRNAATKAAAATTSTATNCSEIKENYTNAAAEETVVTNKTTTSTTTHPTYTASGGDVIIDMGEPMMDIQQQQKILQSRGQDAANQGQSFYERLANNDKRIPRANIIGSTKATYFAPTASHCYVDETVRFNALERNGNNNAPPPSTIDAKFLPLDENYKSCKSVLGSEGDKSPELLNKTKTNTIYTKISTPASGSAILTGTTTNNIATLTQRQLDENGNALSEIYQNSSSAVTGTPATIQINAVSPTNANNTAAALLNSCGNVSTSATVTISPHTVSTTVSTSATVTTTFTSGPSQAKAKAKKKSQQERNTKTVDLEKVAGYRGKDPVEELVKYIESSGEDKQTVSKSSGDKKKERKKDKEKHQKLKKSNSLEELRSGAKMEVHELKRTAATTESNAVLVRQKSSGGGGGGGKKNNSSSTAEINKNLDSSSSRNTTNPRKSERRSWGNEDLKYLEDQQNANLLNEEKTTATGNPIKEKKNKIGGSVAAVAAAGLILTSSKEEKEIKDKTNERNERNLANSQLNSLATIQTDKIDKLEKAEKLEKMEKSEKPDKPDKLEKSERFEKLENKLEKRKKQTDIPPNAVTVVDILAIESVLPETAEFHVVTKKKKPKKQKVINNLEETTVTFNRTHNFTMQKTATFNQQQQQMTVRYKYYHHDNAANNNNTGISTTNPQNANNSQHNQQTNNQSQQHQQHQQSQQNQTTSSENYNTTTTTSDKSRRKSTSSVPPSEKSDSSDLDSVHSLPIEATTKGNLTNANANSHKLKPQTRTKPMNRNSNNLMGKTLPVPVSYADIARTNKEIADAAANMGSASVILINNNEISLESRNADASLNANEANTSCEEKLLLTAGNTPLTTTPQVATNLSAANLKTHKAKKSQIKQDFPELSSSSCSANNNNDDQKQLSTSNNPKTTIITYSQSLTAVQNNNQTNQNPLAGNNCAANDALQQHSSNVIEHNTKVSPMEQQKNLIVHQHINIPPTQHAQQQILQKSKSVENDTNISSTTAITATPSASLSSNASASYLASLNSNNLDQQYPTLEKTFKRHSSTNVTITATQNNSQQTPFNFAAAAKQQINMNNSNNNNNSNNEQHNINLNKNSNLTTSNTNNSNNNNTNQAALLAANKKSKEKTPPLTTTAITQQITASENAQVTTTTAAAVTAQTNPKKAKKERLQQLQQQTQTFVDQAKQSQNNTLTAAHKKPVKNPLKTSNSLPLGFNSSTNASSSLQNRPAVIILNDYRNSGGICAADNQFTFGDFNEEELKLFDDDHHKTNVGGNEDTAENMQDINLNQSAEEEKKQQSMTKSEANFKSPTTNTYFNDSGTSCGNEMLLSSSIDASSPNTSFNNNNNSSIALANSNCAGGALHLPAHNNNNNNNNNQSSDSGIYVDKINPSNSSLLCKSTSSSNSCSQGNINQQLTPNEKEENDKLNSFLSKTRCASNHSSMDNLAQVTPPPPPPQQLETCNDIETAIIAAARAAAKQQHQPSQQQQQQQVKSSNDSSNSSSFSSSSLTTKASTAYQQTHLHHQQQQQQPTLPPPQHHQQFSHSINSNKYGRGAVNHMSSYHHQTSSSQQQQYDEDYVMNNDGEYDDCFSNNTPRSRSPSRPRCISIAGGTVANKEFDIHFIPPSTMPTAFTTQQHNDIIVDFIGSAWEEVANSKVTKVYDGQ